MRRVDDLQARPSDHEREALTTRIERVAAAGKISTADRDIRLGNVKSAQSRAELDLMSRDLDQLEGALGGGGSPATDARPYSTFDPAQVSSTSGPTVVVTGSRTGLVVGVVVAVVALLGTGAFGLVAAIGLLGSSSSSSSPRALPPAQTGDADPETVNGPSTGWSLTTQGVTRFLAAYQKKFRTPDAIDLVMYPDYVVVDVPVAGGQGRQAGWVYRTSSGWTSFGQPRATTPGAVPVDTGQLDVAALMRNLHTATTTLEVEEPDQAYVVVRYNKSFDQAPVADIYVSNRFHETGYLSTHVDGTVVHAYPYSR